MIDYLQVLKNACRYKGIEVFTAPVLNDPRFKIWSGSGNEKHHHYGDGGLLKHTHEVWEYASNITTVHNGKCTDMSKRAKANELFVSIIWHDYGKIWDYQKNENEIWGKHNNHARRIHHISRSALEFEKWYSYHCLDSHKSFIDGDEVIHNILSHHGSREHGSLVAPATRGAWILHLADNLSARLDDCDKHDIIDI